MTAELEGGEKSAARPGRTLPLGKTRYPFYRRLGGLQDVCVIPHTMNIPVSLETLASARLAKMSQLLEVRNLIAVPQNWTLSCASHIQSAYCLRV